MTAELNRLWHGYRDQSPKGTQLPCSPRAQSISMTASAASLPVSQVCQGVALACCAVDADWQLQGQATCIMHHHNGTHI